jgi:Tol biopolymer transport system component
VGPYQVVASLGAGGMGEVYRAHDSTLGRDVAIKVVAAAVAGDPERLAGLEREARILASLNHPNIATIHGLESTKAGPALVLELVEGQTLQDRLLLGPPALSETLNWARQIADALDASHERGIVHRDLKPANIKIRPDGSVKVLDFGIAKLLDRDRSDGAAATTITETAEGVLIGTPYYMSPEQARGEESTRRSDVWAFGAVLFEMLTGKRAFAGATTPDVLAAILRGSPDWDALPSGTPPVVVRLVRRCLERDPRARLRDIGDARLDLEDEERSLRAGPRPTADNPTGRASRRRPWALGVLAAIALAAAGTAVYFGLTRGGKPGPEIRLQLAPPAGTHFVNIPAAVSPDGRHIVLVAAPDGGGPATLWLRPLSAPQATELPETAGALYPFWSADSRFVGFFADGELRRVAVAGGNPIGICKAPAGRGGLWLDDDTIVFAPAADAALSRVSAAGGSPAAFTSLAQSERSHRFPQRLPGRQLLYFVSSQTFDGSGTRLVSIDEPQRQIAFLPVVAGGYLNGFLLFSPRADVVLAQRMTLPDGRLTGEPMEVTHTRLSETLGRTMTSTASTGVIATLGTSDSLGQLVWTSRTGVALETVGQAASQRGVELSPDGQHVATFRSNGLWTMSLSRPVATKVTERGVSRHPVWSPDGARLVSMYQGRAPGRFDVVTIAVASGAVTTEHQDTTAVRPMSWLGDGRMVWIRNYQGDSSIWVKPATSQPSVFLKDETYLGEARVSPDGRWILYSTSRSGRFEIEVRSFPESGPAYPVSVDGGGYPRWRADGRELYFLSADGHVMAAAFAPGAPPKIGALVRLFPASFPLHSDHGFFSAYEYDVSKDGSRFLVNRTVSPPEAHMTIIVNWNPRSMGGAAR